eukprot:jgi/Picre1/29247/NNA_004639.t1
MSSPYPPQGDGDKDGLTPGLGKSSLTPPPVAYEKGDTVVDVESLLRSCSAKGLSSKLTDRIREADVDQDGVLSVDELVEVMRREMQAVSDRKLFRNILIALFVAVLVLIATLCGTVYCHRSAQQTVTVGPELLALLDFPESLSNVHSLVIPAMEGDETTVYKTAKLISSPGTGSMNIATVDGTLLLVNQSGVSRYMDDAGHDGSEATRNSTWRPLGRGSRDFSTLVRGKRKRIWDVTESIDYTPFNNRVALRRYGGVGEQSRSIYGFSGRTLFTLLATLLTGILIGITGKMLEVGIDVGVGLRNRLVMGLLLGEQGTVSCDLALVGLSVVTVGVSASAVQWLAPGAAGSGVSLVMALLNGNDIAGLLTPMVFVVKLVGTALSRMACLALGPEAPLVHLGACVASIVFYSGQRIVDLRRLRERREILRGDEGSGVFECESEACSVWSKKTAWRCLLATAIAVFSMSQIFPALGGGYILSFSGIYPLSDRQWLFQLPFVVFMSAVSGLLGAFFNLMRRWMQRHRVSKRKHMLRVLEACVVALVSSSAFLLLPRRFGQCLDLPPTWEESQVLQYDCPAGQYNDLATALFASAPVTIRSFLGLGSESEPINRICTASMPCYYTLTALICVSMTYLGLMVLSSGLAVPGGLFMPSAMVGGALGAFFGILINPIVPMSWDIQPGVYAIVGAAAMLAAVFRSSVSLVVILVEGTRGINFLPGILIAVIISNFIAHWIHPDGIYESELEVDGRVFFLRQEPPGRLRSKTAESLMASPVVGLYEFESVARVLQVLSSTTHNGFPVFASDRSGSSARPRLSGFILRSQLLILLGEQVFCDEEGDYLSHPSGMEQAEYEERLDALMHHAVHGGSEIVDALVEDSDDEQDGDGGEFSVPKIMSKALQIMEDLSREPSFADILSAQENGNGSTSREFSSSRLTEMMADSYINLSPFMDLGMITVRPDTPAAHVHQMFVTMSLRHLCVTDSLNGILGIVTRKDLDRAAGHGWWRSNKIAPDPPKDTAVLRSTSWFQSSLQAIAVPPRRMLSDLLQSLSPSPSMERTVSSLAEQHVHPSLEHLLQGEESPQDSLEDNVSQ